MLIVKLAWRNIWRNWRRSAITITTVVFAVFLAVLMQGIQNGTYGANFARSIEMFMGYAQVQHNEYKESPTLTKSFRINDSLKLALDSDPEIIGYAPRILASGLIGYNHKSYGVAIMSIDPDMEKGTTTISDRVRKGKFLSNKRPDHIVVGQTLLENLNAGLGDTVVVLSSCRDGSLGNMKYVIGGVSYTGVNEMDAMSIMMTLESADELLAMYGTVTAIAINTGDMGTVDNVMGRITGRLGDERLIARDWKDLMPELVQMKTLDDSGNYVFLLLLFIILGFGILNTMLMSITERFREFGIMLAIGTRTGKMLGMVMLETMFITIVGLIIGSAVAFSLNYYVLLNPIALGGNIAEMYQTLGFEPMIYTEMNFGIFINTYIAILIMSALSFIYPAIRVLKLEALKGIRYT